jgi:hypothetical protein
VNDAQRLPSVDFVDFELHGLLFLLTKTRALMLFKTTNAE